MRSVVWISVVLLPLLAQGQQNLVPNGGFENLTSCPYPGSGGGDIWLASPWDNIVDFGGGADVFNVCSQPQIIEPDTFYLHNVPENNRGFQYARSGNGYAGFYAVSDPESYPNGREFLQSPLNQSMLANVRYEVTFYVSLAEKFQYAVGSLGVYFSTLPLYASDLYLDNLPAGIEPQVQSPAGVIYDDKENWMEVRDTFVIRGGEDGQLWMTIGNFMPDSLSQITFVDSGAAPNYDRGYYYIDDVSVVALDSMPDGITEQGVLSIQLWPNPVSAFLRFSIGDEGRSFKGMTAQVVDAVGRTVRQKNLKQDRGDAFIDVLTLHGGTYILKLTDRDGIIATKMFVKLHDP